MNFSDFIDAINRLSDEPRVLRESVDELRDKLQWAVQKPTKCSNR